MNNLKDEYREEANCDIYYEKPEEHGSWCYTFEYVTWLESKVESFNKNGVNCSLYGRGITAKQAEAEDYVIEFTKDNGKPPTYRDVAKHFKVQVNTAYHKLRHCRHLMKHK